MDGDSAGARLPFTEIISSRRPEGSMLVNLSVSCSNCGTTRLVDDDDLGKLVRCGCGRELELRPRFKKYRIEKLISEGGMGVVYLAADLEADRSVALKVPHSLFWRHKEFGKRFEREAQAAKRLRHPNLCPIYEADFSGKTPYIAMAFLEGETLRAHLKKHGALPIRRAVELTMLIARFMAVAHSANVVHRDLKPSNIMIDERGEPVIMDFGLVRFTDSDVTPLTYTGERLGSREYMSPEQAAGESRGIGPASDVFSLGVIFYELLTDTLPFHGGLVETLAAILHEEPPRPSSIRPEIDQELERLCLRALSKRIEKRYASMSEFESALGNYLERRAGDSATEIPLKTGSEREERESTVLTDYRTRPLSDSQSDTVLNELTSSTGAVLKRVPPGEFVMGSDDSETSAFYWERPKHLVKIGRAIYLASTPVTQAQYVAIVGRNPSLFAQKPDHPVERVSWHDSVAYCNELSIREGLPTYYQVRGEPPDAIVSIPDLDATGYRLPTEAEWEYACRAGSRLRFGFGDDERDLDRFAWHAKNSSDRTHPVGAKSPNAFGLLDMHGNVWEWCFDWYDDRYYQASPSLDPRGPAKGGSRVARGGSFQSVPRSLRAAFRGRFDPDLREGDVGFRIVRTFR